MRDAPNFGRETNTVTRDYVQLETEIREGGRHTKNPSLCRMLKYSRYARRLGHNYTEISHGAT
jgi:hypothetical protein